MKTPLKAIGKESKFWTYKSESASRNKNEPANRHMRRESDLVTYQESDSRANSNVPKIVSRFNCISRLHTHTEGGHLFKKNY